MFWGYQCPKWSATNEYDQADWPRLGEGHTAPHGLPQHFFGVKAARSVWSYSAFAMSAHFAFAIAQRGDFKESLQRSCAQENAACGDFAPVLLYGNAASCGIDSRHGNVN